MKCGEVDDGLAELAIRRRRTPVVPSGYGIGFVVGTEKRTRRTIDAYLSTNLD